MHIVRWSRKQPTLVAVALVLVLLMLYTGTLLSGIGSGDIAEFQRVPPTLGLAHPTGYPLYTMLGWLWSRIPLGLTMAWRMNMFSAVTAAAAGGLLYLCGRRLGQWMVVAMVGTLILATSATFWTQVTHAEVWGLAALLQVLVIYTLLRWRDQQGPLWLAGLAFGLALSHHRTSMFLGPGIIGFVALSRRPR